MNKAKKVAWHKHLKNAKKRKEKLREARKSGTAVAPATARR